MYIKKVNKRNELYLDCRHSLVSEHDVTSHDNNAVLDLLLS